MSVSDTQFYSTTTLMGVTALLLHIKVNGRLMLDEAILFSAMMICTISPIIGVALSCCFAVNIVFSLVELSKRLGPMQNREVFTTREFRRNRVIDKLTQ